MSNYARIDGGAVVELFSTDGDISQMFHPSLVWVPCGDSVAVGDAWDGEQFRKPTPAPVAAPASVTMRQARAALIEADLFDAVEAAIAAIPDAKARRMARNDWEFAATVDRDWPLLTQLAAALGLSDDDVRELFTLAATL